MSEGKPAGRFERILVACNTTLPGSTALEAAAALAANFQAELAGLFVEDVNLLRLAALPFTRELGLASAAVRPIDVPDVEREYKLHASLVRRALEDAAVTSSLRWSFQVIRGHPLVAALSARREADLLVVGAAAPSAARTTRETMPRHTGAQAAGPRPLRGLHARPIAVLYDASPQAERALTVAVALAAGTRCPLTVWVRAEREGEFTALRERARAWLVAHESGIKILWLKGRDVRAVAQAVSAEAPALLLWYDPLDSQQLTALLAALQCPLALLA